MPSTTRIRSELPGGDPALLNRLAWTRRWIDRDASVQNATTARRAAKIGAGERSRIHQGLALRTLAWHARWLGNLDETMGLCLSAETYLTESEFPGPRAVLYALLGSVHFARNRVDLANCAIDRGFWLMREHKDADIASAMTELLLTKATIQRYAGERARAGITLGRAQELAPAEEKPVVEYCTAGWLLDDRDAEAAQARIDNAFDLVASQGNTVLLPYLHTLMGHCSFQMGRIDEATESLQTGMAMAQARGDKRLRCFTHRHLAKLELARDDLEAAETHLAKAAKLAQAQGHNFERKRVALARASLFEGQGKYKKAVAQHNLAWRLQNETRAH
jgi:tetratricopeptide (TPR) repeat protein